MYQYYNEMNTEDLLNSPQWTDIHSYSQDFDHEPTEEELLELGVYADGSALMKDFNMSINRTSCVVKFRMTVQPIIGGGYRLSTRGVAIDNSFNDFINDVSTGLGYAIDDYTKTDIASEIINNHNVSEDIDIEKMLINGIIDVYGQSAYDYNLMDLVYNYFEQFPNINNPYVVNQRPLPNGQNFISIYEHGDFINNIVAYDDGTEIFEAFTPVQLKTSLDQLAETNTNVQNILSNSQIIRVCFRRDSPEDVKMYLNGYKLSNAEIVTTTESGSSQHYAGVVTHVTGGRYTYSPWWYSDHNFHEEQTWDADTGYTSADIFYNYKRSDWFAYDGLGHVALVGSGPIIDSIGNVSSLLMLMMCISL